MKYPGGYIAFGSIHIILGLIFMIPVALFFYDLAEDKSSFPFSVMLLFVFLCSVSIWLIFTAIVWFYRFKLSFIALILTLLTHISTLVFIDVIIFHNITSRADIVALIAVTITYATLILFLIIFASLKRVRTHAFNENNKPTKKAIMALIIAFVILMVVPTIVIATVQKFSYVYKPIRIQQLLSSGDMGTYIVDNVADNDLKTWWTPSNGNGRNTWIQVNFVGKELVEAVEILPGSHNPDYEKYGNLFPLNSRLSKARLSFSDGSFQDIVLKDRDEKQIVAINPIRTSYVRLNVLDTIKGKKWDDLCISHYIILQKNQRFKQ